MFLYGLNIPHDRPFGHIERYHAVELACRMMFECHTAAARTELEAQAKAYADAGLGAESSRIRQLSAAFDGFNSYMNSLLHAFGVPAEDPDELRISQHRIARWHFLRAVEGAFLDELAKGIEWFEKSALGNDAPWIEGERLLLRIAGSSWDLMSLPPAEREARGPQIEKDLIRASELLRSPYPLAVSLGVRGLSRCLAKDTACIRDLSMAVGMVVPKTPETRQLREVLENARWHALEQFTKGSHSSQAISDFWHQIQVLLPLLSDVAGEDRRLKMHFAPYRDLLQYRSDEVQIDMVSAISDPNRRGRALEDLLVSMIEAAPGLRVLDVRHRNNYEEIDIIVSSTAVDALLSYWGPLFIVECKNWDKKVGTDPVRAFYTKMTTKKGAVRLGVMISASGFTRGVKELSRVFQDGLVLTLSLNELRPVSRGETTFSDLLRTAIPTALFA